MQNQHTQHPLHNFTRLFLANHSSQQNAHTCNFFPFTYGVFTKGSFWAETRLISGVQKIRVCSSLFNPNTGAQCAINRSKYFSHFKVTICPVTKSPTFLLSDNISDLEHASLMDIDATLSALLPQSASDLQKLEIENAKTARALIRKERDEREHDERMKRLELKETALALENAKLDLKAQAKAGSVVIANAYVEPNFLKKRHLKHLHNVSRPERALFYKSVYQENPDNLIVEDGGIKFLPFLDSFVPEEGVKPFEYWAARANASRRTDNVLEPVTSASIDIGNSRYAIHVCRWRIMEIFSSKSPYYGNFDSLLPHIHNIMRFNLLYDTPEHDFDKPEPMLRVIYEQWYQWERATDRDELAEFHVTHTPELIATYSSILQGTHPTITHITA
jgi:hypothetical protein